ncbi:MAG: DNA-directed RNA polymerase subunit alpha [Planctomycetota bacterium]|jgi:DNA-directed RNA polymerase subunit alpha
MHVRWRGLELPAKVEADPRSLSPTFGRFIAEPFERGFGTTVGNSLRRILLSSLEGCAVTGVKIEGVEHEFSSIPGFYEDVADIILNLKGLVVSMDHDEPRRMKLAAEGPGEVTAELIEADPSIRIHNPEKVIATLTEPVDFIAEFTIERGRGYRPASEQGQDEEQVIGEIPIDAIFSPVQRVRFRVEDTRVGQRTNYDRLVLDVWTDGTVRPEMAVVEAAKILRKHLNPFVQADEIGSMTVAPEVVAKGALDQELIRKLNTPVSQLNLSVRAANCLESARLRTIADLLPKPEEELLAIRSFGKTSLREVKRKLEELGLVLGSPLPEGFVADESRHSTT